MVKNLNKPIYRRPRKNDEEIRLLGPVIKTRLRQGRPRRDIEDEIAVDFRRLEALGVITRITPQEVLLQQIGRKGSQQHIDWLISHKKEVNFYFEVYGVKKTAKYYHRHFPRLIKDGLVSNTAPEIPNETKGINSVEVSIEEIAKQIPSHVSLGSLVNFTIEQLVNANDIFKKEIEYLKKKINATENSKYQLVELQQKLSEAKKTIKGLIEEHNELVAKQKLRGMNATMGKVQSAVWGPGGPRKQSQKNKA